jgi:hypothetical protein
VFQSPPPHVLWEKYGLLAHPLRTAAAGDARYASLPRANRFRLALEEAGGLFLWFGQFLTGRADLLPSPYVSQLRALPAPQNATTPPSAIPELRGRVSAAELLRVTPGCEVYAATDSGGPIVLEIYRQGKSAVSERAWSDFERRVRLLQDSEEAAVTQPFVLERFREWLDLHHDVARKRVMLRNLQEIPIRCVSRFPRPIPDFPSERCLAYHQMEGSPLVEAGGRGISEAGLHVWSESLVEQALLLSLVDAEAQPENYVLLPDGGLGFRALPALVSVPVEWHYELLQYVTSAAAGNTTRALQMLSRMSGSENPYGTEQLLLEKLSALQPELKINMVTPESVVQLENYWRAQARTPWKPPLFLELLQRNLAVLGQSAESAPPSSDVVAEALWPVLGRILQFRIGDILSTEKGQEWLLSSGLLAMSAVRQVAITMEQVRDNDLALVLDRQETEDPNGGRNRRIASLIGSAIALVLFLFFLQLAFRAGGGALGLLAGAAAAVSAVALSVLLSRIE